jgi:hypothetical protein
MGATRDGGVGRGRLSSWSMAAVGGLAALLASRGAAAQPSDATSPAGAPAQAGSSAPLAATRPMAVVHVDSPLPVTVQARNEDDEWDTVCTSPCDKPLPATGTYRITGPGIRDSRTFHLDAGSPTTLEVTPSSSGGHAAAVVVTVIGAIGLTPAVGVTAVIVGGEIIGAILICPFATAFVPKDQQNAAYTNCLGDIATFFGQGYGQPYVWGPAIAGGVLLTAGIVMLVKTPRTGVKQTAGSAALFAPPASAAWGMSGMAPASPLAGPHLDRPEALALPAPQVVPLVSLQF